MSRSSRPFPPLPRARRPALFPLIALSTLTLAGCAGTGRDYHLPESTAPIQWSAAANSNAPDPALLAEWWRQFNDPVLDGLVKDAIAANLDLATAQAQLREARARRGLAGAQLGPSVRGSLSASTGKSSTETGGTGATRDLYSAGFDASWEVDVFGRLRRGVDAASADLEATTESLHDTRVSLIAEVVLNYVDLRSAENRLKIAEATLAARSESYDLVRWRLQAGIVSQLDAAQARTELESTRATLPPLRTAVAEARHRLAVLLARAPGELQSRLEPTASVPLASPELAVGIPADTLRRRPDVRAAERRVAAQTSRLSEAEADRFPTLNLSGFIGLEALTLSGLATGGTHSLLGAITAPIFNAGRIKSNVMIQDALLEQALLTYRASVLTALEEVENALVAVANTSERRERLVLATASARETVEIAEQRYATGLADFLAVLDAQRTLLNLEDQLAISTGELASAQIQLYKALGGGWSPPAQPRPETVPTKESP